MQARVNLGVCGVLAMALTPSTIGFDIDSRISAVALGFGGAVRTVFLALLQLSYFQYETRGLPFVLTIPNSQSLAS